jgi:hypothetical protein
MRRPALLTSVCLVIATVASATSPAVAQSGLQITPDGRRTLISKDVGTERWSISVSRDDATVTGNVYRAAGEAPAFAWCQTVNLALDPVKLDCFANASCAAAPCPDDWVRLDRVEIPRSFFLPRSDAGRAPQADARSTQGSAAGGAAERASGVQITPDARRVLINKDVGDERWAIAVNLDDRTVTGTAFADGASPSFVWCEQKAIADDQVTLSCSGAASCTGEPCAPEAWVALGDVGLPGAFFRPPTPAAAGACLAATRAGDMATAAVACSREAQERPDDGRLALARGVAEAFVAALEPAPALDLLARAGVSLRGSAFDVCKLGLRSAEPEREANGSLRARRGAAIQDAIASALVTFTDRVRDGLQTLPQGAMQLDLADVPYCMQSFGDSIEIDATDVRALRSAIELMAAVAHAGAAYDVDFDVAGAIDAGSSLGEVLQANPNALTLRPTGSAELGLARAALDRSLADFTDAVGLLRAERDDQSDDVLVAGPADLEGLDAALDVAGTVRDALTGEGTFDAERYRLAADQRVRLGPFFAGEVASLRGLLPLDATGRLDFCRLPDPTLHGAAPDLTQAEVQRVLRLSCAP